MSSRDESRRGAALPAVLAVALLAFVPPACGGDDAPGSEIPGGADPEAAQVIDDWSTALREGDVEAAAEFFALPTLAQNGTPPLRLDTREAIVEFNAALPCGAELIRAEDHGRYVLATFELTERPGEGECGDGVGSEASTAFLIEDGKISAWIRAGGDSLPEPSVEGPVI